MSALLGGRITKNLLNRKPTLRTVEWPGSNGVSWCKSMVKNQ